MVKTRRSNGENGEVDEGNFVPNDGGSVSDEKASNWSTRELRSSQFKVARKIQRWPAKYINSRRRRSIKMNRIVYPESDTEPEKYSRSRRSRQVRVFFADENESAERSMKIRSRGPRKNYMEDSEDKPIQQNVRRSCRQRKLLHHNFNESWITNELKVRGYPGLYGIQRSSSSDEFTSGDDRPVRSRKLMNNHPPAIMDVDTQSGRQRRTSARFNKKIIDDDTDSDNDKNQTVIEKKPAATEEKEEGDKSQIENGDKEMKSEPDNNEEALQDSESNQGPARPIRRSSRKKRTKKEDFGQQETATESESSEPTNIRAKTFTIRKRTYSLRERKPKILRRKTIRPQTPSSSSSSSTSSDSEEDLNVSMKNKTKGRQKSKSSKTSMDDKKTDRALRDIQPVEVDSSVRFTSVGGLDEHIQCLREMVLFPLMYPNLFSKFKTRPARGVLFHGPPGTGKTLLARALATECSLLSGRKVAFFMRKGADCLRKWVGESERHLKLLFQQANKMKPSIIFFDEIDALAPVRSVRQDQVHASVVGTLLAEMDGLCDRGEVIIIGATNRLDAVDPALRRAGRFDRELHFPAPARTARKDILRIHTAHWTPTPDEDLLDTVADVTTGYGGSDLKALCSEAVLKALRRVYPQVYESEHALVIDPNNVHVRSSDVVSALRSLVSSSSRGGPPPPRALPPHSRPLLAPQLAAVHDLLNTIHAPCLNGLGDPSLSSSTLLILGECADTYIAPALLAEMEDYTVKELSVATLHSALSFTPEQAVISLFSECRRVSRCVLWVRGVSGVCASLGAAVTLLPALWRARAAGDRALLLATDTGKPDDMPAQILDLFPVHKDCVYEMREPNSMEVVNFLKPIITELPLVAPVVESRETPPPLPLAPPPPPPRESAEESSRRKRKEDYKLRELRIFLRDICRKLASNRRFYKFTKPVELEEVTDYLEIVKQPMDLETMMTKVDMHKYNCAKEFLDDIDLICANALEYNPDRTSSDKQIRHEACSLRDHAHALIDVEMDSDFEQECRLIAASRRDDGRSDTDLPDFIYTASNLPLISDKEGCTPQNGDKSETHLAKRKRRRMNAWSKGFVTKRQKTVQKAFNNSKDITMAITDEESKENKPITSTPLPNGDAHHSASEESGTDEDLPLRRRSDHSGHQTVKDGVIGSPVKSPEKTPTKASPKKRNSGHEASSGDAEKVLINKTELDNIMYKHAKTLRCIGLEALLDLHSQLSTALHKYEHLYDRNKLPQDYQAIIQRYVHQLVKK